MSDIISDPAKYRAGWHGGLPETPCGSGSTLRETRFQRKWLPEMVAKYGIIDIADIGAGDLNWIKQTNLGCAYRAYDLVPRHPSVQEFDLLTDPIPEADCLMVLWVINHLPPAMQEIAMRKLTAAKSRFLIMTYDERMEPCADLPYSEKAILKHRKGVDFEIRLHERN